MKGKRTSKLGREVLVTVALVLAYRLGAHIPLPGVPVTDLTGQMGALALANMFTGGALARASLMSLGVMPYITAQIVLQMVGYAVPPLGRRWRADNVGHMEQVRLTRWITMALATAEGLGYALLLSRMGVSLDGAPGGTVGAVALVTFGLVVGEAMVMLMGELIDQAGIGQGMSVMIFANVLASVPPAIVESVEGGPKDVAMTILALLFIVVATMAITFVERGQRRIPIHVARSAAAGGSRIVGEASYLPIKVSAAGVVPVIFSSVVLFVPQLLSSLMPGVHWLHVVAGAITSGPVMWVAEVVIIVLFSWAYAQVVIDPEETAESLAKQGAFIEGVRPGNDTAAHIREAIREVAVPGALFMALVAVIPQVLAAATGSPLLSALGGTSLLVIVDVAVDLSQRVEAERADDGYETGRN